MTRLTERDLLTKPLIDLLADTVAENLARHGADSIHHPGGEPADAWEALSEEEGEADGATAVALIRQTPESVSAAVEEFLQVAVSALSTAMRLRGDSQPWMVDLEALQAALDHYQAEAQAMRADRDRLAGALDVTDEPPLGSIVIDRDSDPWHRRIGGWLSTYGAVIGVDWESLNAVQGPLRLIHTGSEDA